jgi:allophanate hydrolase
MSMTISSLLAKYRLGECTPRDVIASLPADDEAYACAWISRVAPQALAERARRLEAMLHEDPRAIERLPLYGIPFAVKDNIDVAGMPTTAACPAFSYVPERSATVVEKLEAAGAILVGKTNMDQFATGLTGTRSPYGVVPNAFNRAYIPGGSSSGSAVTVARGTVSFALGTDTAGSGRLPAGLNNIVGLKPSRGLISARGVVPACQSLDCVCVLALTVPDAVAVFHLVRGFDPSDPWSRELDLSNSPLPDTFRFALPAGLEFHGDVRARHAFADAVERLRRLGGQPVEIDFAPFLDAAALLLEGPWVAERLAAMQPFMDRHADQMHPVVREVIAGSGKFSAADLFAGMTRLQALRKSTAAVWERADVLVVPTAPTLYTIEECLAEPLVNNRRLGHYAGFANLLDLAACAVPASMRADGLPSGITLIAPAGRDLVLADLAQRFHQRTGLTLGARGGPLPRPDPIALGDDSVRLVVVGAHLSGLPLNHRLTKRGAKLEKVTRTSARYRLFALPGGLPPKPGMVRDSSRGSALQVEVWRLPLREYGSFVAGIPSPLSIGRVELEDGEWVQGFLCEGWALAGAEEITQLGGWRAFLARSHD